MTPLELLAPARDLECGIAAIDHGADAVYIGAQRFGARAAAGNSVDDIRKLCRYAHVFNVKVYVTVNTIIYESELQDTQQLVAELHDAGADAILVQDMGLLRMPLPPISLHASTQTDNRTKEKVAWLTSKGFERVVLARELSAEEIKEIHNAVPEVELEVFVHGALCVSFSGLCYASQYCFRRSANRGECAQFCRMEFDLEDASGNQIEHNRHLLSLKDMCRIDDLELLAECGVSSFKIEGRLKDKTYVKNVTAAYSQRMDELVRRNPGKYKRASLGHCRYNFKPDLKKTFNRGFTDYFLKGRNPDIVSFDTPKAIGEFVGRVKELSGKSFNIAGTASFANGDGLCFMNDNHKLEGFRVNRAEGNRIFPHKMPTTLKPGMAVYRNKDIQFERLLANGSSVRTIPIEMELRVTDKGFRLTASAEGAVSVSADLRMGHVEAQKPQRENIIRQLTRLGGTPFECSGVRFAEHSGNEEESVSNDFNYFIPSSNLATLRREVVGLLTEKLLSSKNNRKRVASPAGMIADNRYPDELTYNYNVSNSKAAQFYEEAAITGIAPAFELQQPAKKLLMQCRHCLQFSLGYCTKRGGARPRWHEPLRLKLADGRRFRLQFDCLNCQMNVYADQ